MTTVRDLIEETRSILDGYYRFQTNWLDGAISTTDTTLTLLDNVMPLDVGSLIGVSDELILVRSVNPNLKELTVKRGVRNTTATLHSDASEVEIHPEFPRSRIRATLKQEINSWAGRLFDVTFEDVDYSTTNTFYDILDFDTPLVNVLKVWYRKPNQTAWASVRSWSMLRQADGLTTSGYGLQINDTLASGSLLRVVYSTLFDTEPFDDTFDLTDDGGIPVSMHDIPPLGALWRLLTGREAPRVSGRGWPEPRQAQEVPPTARSSLGERYHQARDARITEEARLLAKRYSTFSGI